MKTRVWGVLLILLMICPACSQLKDYISIAKGDSVSKEYLIVLKKWTRDETVYVQFETRAHIVATYKSREFNEAYLNEYSRVYQLSAGERKEKQEFQMDATSDFTEFLFYAYIPDKESNDFSKSNSIWKIFLLGENGDKIYPVEVRRIEKITPLIEGFFPYVKQYYGMFYSLKFSPRTPSFEQRPLKLVFTSILGSIEADWTTGG